MGKVDKIYQQVKYITEDLQYAQYIGSLEGVIYITYTTYRYVIDGVMDAIAL